jgi:hypothetical protein
MIYITFDTNIWIYLLDDSWKEYNPLDHLEHWLEEGLLELLVPDIIKQEWEKNREAQRDRCKQLIRDFFDMADEILPSAFISGSRKPEQVDQVVDRQLQRIDALVNNLSTPAPLPVDAHQTLVAWGLAKKAPLHKKTSMADAIILVSLYDFAEQHPGDEFLFISKNTEDFFQKQQGKNKIHEDLSSDFQRLGINAYTTLRHALRDLLERLPVTVDFSAMKRIRLRDQMEQNVFNPAVMKTLEHVKETYLDNIEHLDMALKKESPSKQEMLFVFGLLESDPSYGHYFYRRVSSPAWFTVLKEKGVYHPANNPSPQSDEKGIHIPLWEPMLYPETLARQIPDSTDGQIIQQLSELIISISEQPKENYRTWISLLKILRYFPAFAITEKMIGYIPLWLSGQFQSTFESIELCEHILPKFFKEDPSPDEKRKAHQLLRHLLSIHRTEPKNKYSSPVAIQYLSESLNAPKHLAWLAANGDDEILLFLGRQIKYLIYDYPQGAKAQFEKEGETFDVYFGLEKENMSLVMRDKNEVIPDFEMLERGQLLNQILHFIRGQAPEYQPTDNYSDPIRVANLILDYDTTAGTSSSPVYGLGGRYYGNQVLQVFGLTFRNWLNTIATIDPERAIRLFRIICFDGRYRLSFYRRVAFYVMGNHWKTSGSFFWELIRQNPEPYFSSYEYRKDLFHLLERVAVWLTMDEITELQQIIDKYEPYRQLNWFAALRSIKPFKEGYETLSAELGYDHQHFEQLGEIRFRSGTISPLSEEQLRLMTSQEIVNYIATFRPERARDEYTIDGLATQLNSAIFLDPGRFVSELPVFDGLPFIYSYHIFMGLQNAWRDEKNFDWDPVLAYACRYISLPDFQNNQLKLANDGWGADRDWVQGAIGNLLSEGLNNEKHVIPASLMPKVKKLLTGLVEGLQLQPDSNDGMMDYPHHLVNSAAGKVQRALLDYALCLARMNENPTWEAEIPVLFDNMLRKGFLESYILLGMYYQQFNYLDSGWLSNKAKTILEAEDALWYGFIGGLGFAGAPYTESRYQQFYPHYQKALDQSLSLSDNYDHGLVFHLLCFYFWGLEDLTDNGLLYQVIRAGKIENLLALQKLFWRHQDYADNLDEADRPAFRQRISVLWQLLADSVPNPETAQEKEFISGLVHLIGFFDTLPDKETQLLLRSLSYSVLYNHNYELIGHLNKIKSAGQAGNLATIVGHLSFDNYLTHLENPPILEIVEFLYQNGQKTAANEFANRIGREGHDFLKDLYKKYNS